MATTTSGKTATRKATKGTAARKAKAPSNDADVRRFALALMDGIWAPLRRREPSWLLAFDPVRGAREKTVARITSYKKDVCILQTPTEKLGTISMTLEVARQAGGGDMQFAFKFTLADPLKMDAFGSRAVRSIELASRWGASACEKMIVDEVAREVEPIVREAEASGF